MVDEMKDSQSFETVKAKVGQITRWWDLTAEYLEKNSTKLGAAVQDVLKATATENPFPEGMDMNWALDVQSAQTLDFFAGIQKGKVALGLELHCRFCKFDRLVRILGGWQKTS